MWCKDGHADSELKEERLLNFVVSGLNEALPLDLSIDVEITPEELYEVLVGAGTDGTPVSHICETTDGSPHDNTIRGHLTNQFNLDAAEGKLFRLTGSSRLRMLAAMFQRCLVERV